MNTPRLAEICILLVACLLTACAMSDVKENPGLNPWDSKAVAGTNGRPITWFDYPIIAHQLNGEEAPVVRWIDTDGDGTSNYRLLCTFKKGRLELKKVVSDTSFKSKFQEASRKTGPPSKRI